MTTPLADLTALAERFQAIARRTPPKYRQEIQAIADLLGTAADFAHSHLAQRILGKSYADFGLEPTQPTQPPNIIYHDTRTWAKSGISNGDIVEHIRQYPLGVTRQEIADHFGLRLNAMHGRLDTLRARGAIVSHLVPSPGCGRPTLFWRLAGTPEPTPAQISIQASRLAHAKHPPAPLPDLESNSRATGSAPKIMVDVDAIFDLLSNGAATADEIADRIGARRSATYKRINVLVREGRLIPHKKPGAGRLLVYSLAQKEEVSA